MNSEQSIEQVLENLRENAKDINVLIVEDDEVLLGQLYTILIQFFRKIDKAKNGLLALNCVEKTKYDIIITDLTMPIVDGFELIETLKKENSKQEVLVISAHSDSETLLKIINLGVDGFILKPLDMSNLIKTLQNTVTNIHQIKSNTIDMSRSAG